MYSIQAEFSCGLYILLIIHIVFSLVLYLLSLARLDIGYLPRNPFYIMFWILVPAVPLFLCRHRSGKAEQCAVSLQEANACAA